MEGTCNTHKVHSYPYQLRKQHFKNVKTDSVAAKSTTDFQ